MEGAGKVWEVFAVQIENPTQALVLMGFVPMALVQFKGRTRPPRRVRPSGPR